MENTRIVPKNWYRCTSEAIALVTYIADPSSLLTMCILPNRVSNQSKIFPLSYILVAVLLVPVVPIWGQESSEAIIRRTPAEKLRPSSSREEDTFSRDLGGLLILGGLFWAMTHPDPVPARRSYRPKRRPAFRPPGGGLMVDFPIYKTRMNEHWRKGGLAKIGFELLLLGIRGRSTNVGLYGNIGYSHYDYTLPRTDRQYLLGSQYIRNGEAGKLYEVSRRENDSREWPNKRISLAEQTPEVGVSLKTFFKSGWFFDIGAGIKFNRQLQLSFVEDFDYLTSRQARLESLKFRGVADVAKTPLVLNIPNSYATFAIGQYSNDSSSPMAIMLTGKIYQLDFLDSGNLNIWYLDEAGDAQPVGFEDQTAFSIGIGIYFWFAKRSRR